MLSSDAMSNESITTRPSFPPVRRVLPALVTQVLVAMVIAGAFAGLYIGLQKAPAPTHLPIAVVNAQLATGTAHALGAKADIREAATDAQAQELVRTHQVVAALVPGATGATLYTASANGRSATGAATALATGAAHAARMTITSTRDLVPLTTSDSQGLSGFYLVFGTTLAAFILAQTMNALAALAGLRVRVIVTVIGSIAAAIVVATIAGPIYTAVPAPFLAVIALLSLLAVGVSLSSLAISTLIGPMGTIVSTLVFTTIGNATSGATISAFLLPPAIATIGAGLPPGAAFRAITTAGYFNGAGIAGPLLTLAVWIAGASAALLLAHRARSRRSEVHEGLRSPALAQASG